MKSFLQSRAVRYMSVVTLMGGGAAGVLATAPSGANFTASGQGAASVETANLHMALGDNHGSSNTFNLTYANLAPGDDKTDTFTVKNTGSVDAEVTVSVGPLKSLSGSPDNINQFKIGIDNVLPLTPVATALAHQPIDLGPLAAGPTQTYTVHAALDFAADNTWQDFKASTAVQVTLTQK
jgi:hypothetical protein